MTDQVSDHAKQACWYFTERLHEAARGYFHAYQVDTGRALDAVLLPWEDLSHEERLLFMLASYPATETLIHAICLVGKPGEEDT